MLSYQQKSFTLMKTKRTFQRWWLVLCCNMDEPFRWYEDYHLAKAAIKFFHLGDDARVVRAVCEEYNDDDCSHWSCGHTWAEAVKNCKNGIYDNYNEFLI